MKFKHLLLALLFFNLGANAQNVGIGTATPNASAQLEVSSTNSGFLPPRMTYAQRNAIVNPAAGLIVYCTDCNNGAGEMNYFNGNTWINMTIGTASNVVAILPSVTICNQIWTTKNLDVSTYRNGDVIPQVTDPTQWASLTTGAWCYYNNNSDNGAIYGKLYNWYAVNDSRGLAPFGWHIPSDVEWSSLENCLGGANFAGGAMKEVGSLHWASPNIGATNSSGFSGIPGAHRKIDGTFNEIGVYAYWWCATEPNTIGVFLRFISYGFSIISRSSSDTKTNGYSVRCIKD